MSLPDPPLPAARMGPEIDSLCEELDLATLAAELDRKPRFPREEFRRLAERGLLGLSLPTRDGGRGLSAAETGAALYRMAYRSGATAFAKLMLQPEFSSVLASHGSEALRSDYFAPLCRGELLIGNQLTEPTAGSGLRELAMEARPDGPNGYRLRGTKSQAAFAADAEAAIVYARVPREPRTSGLSAFLVPQDRAGIERRVVDDLGERWMRRGSVRYDNVPIDAALRIGEEGKALEYVLPELTRERGLLALIYLGVARRSLEETRAHVGARRVSGHPLSDRQAVAFPLVEDWVDGDAATLYARRVLERYDAREPVEAEAAMAKSLAVRVALRTLDHAVQFHGGRGYSNELPFERRWRDVRSGDLAHGSGEVLHATAQRALWPRAPALE